MAQIFVTLPDGTTTAHELPAQEGVIAMLGRKEDCQYIVDSPSISNVHCSFAKSGNDWYMTDQNSANGIYANGNRLGQIRLEPNVPYQLGEVYLYFLDDAQQPGQGAPAVEIGPNGLPVMRARRAPGRRPAGSPLPPLAGLGVPSVSRPKGMSGAQIVLVIFGLIIAFYAGLAVRHYQETGRILPMEQLGMQPNKATKK